ncbi:MAG: terpene cyclase/mutase family protein [bacterium]|nr:terpene cyclase/mutase family protein [bacterium]
MTQNTENKKAANVFPEKMRLIYLRGVRFVRHRACLCNRRLFLELQLDKKGLPTEDPGIDKAIDLGISWIKSAQDNSASRDGGVAWCYSLIDGWGASYPEPTGYIIPTMLDYANLRGDADSRDRAKRMLDWLIGIQFPEGGFQGGIIGVDRVIPVTFNTGQILFGLVKGVQEFGIQYREPLNRAASWLVNTQDSDGCWRKFPTPYATSGDKTYETHVAWALFEAARLEPGNGYAEAALRNIRWALTNQTESGWFSRCCLTDPSKPLTHTIGYALRGIIEAYRFSGEKEFLNSAVRTCDGLLSAIRNDGYLPGRLFPNWKGAVRSVCLTGSVQIAHSLLLVYKIIGDERYRDAAFSLNKFVRRTIKTTGPVEMVGGVKGSFPVSGDYCPWQFINWAVKFHIDSNIAERSIHDSAGSL